MLPASYLIKMFVFFVRTGPPQKHNIGVIIANTNYIPLQSLGKIPRSNLEKAGMYPARAACNALLANDATN